MSAPIPDDCAGQIHVCAFRVCALDEDGTPLVGAGSMYVSNALAKATIKPVYDAGDEIKEKNACGETLIDFLDDPTFVRADLDLDFILPDPYLHAILISNGSLLLPSGGGVGFAFPPVGKVGGNGVSIEMYAKRVIGSSQSSVHPWALWGLPKVRSLQLGDRELSSTAQHSLITGQCNENPNWFDGPTNDWDGVATDRCAQWIPVDTIPDTACGAEAVLAS